MKSYFLVVLEINTMLGRDIFQGHTGTLKYQKYGFRTLSLELNNGFSPNFLYIFYCDIIKS